MKPTQKNPSNTSDKPSENTLPPAVSLPLTGRHLIEASAGTGKTWTLTGVVLRLLVEDGQPCDKIIATTFTRSAAAEMRERIRGRLQDFQGLLRQITQNSYAEALANSNEMENADIDTRLDIQVDAFWQWFTAHIEGIGNPTLMAAVKDPINDHLIKMIAKHEFSQPLANKTAVEGKVKTDGKPDAKNEHTQSIEANTDKSPTRQPNLTFRIALQRTNTALTQLDRLFVSTLDSLCQKWLREFSSETGYASDVQVSSDVKPIVMAMIHDQLRAFWTKIYQQSPEIYQLMAHSNQLHDASKFYDAVDKALNFYTAKIDEVEVDNVDMAAIKSHIQAIDETEFDPAFLAYFDEQYRLDAGMAKKNLHTKFKAFNEIKSALVGQKIDNIMNLSKAAQDVLAALKDQVENGSGFKKNFDAQSQQFNALPMVQYFYQLAMDIEHLTTHFADLNAYFTQFIARYVRDNLPKYLEAQRLTTFSLQLARLNRALEGRQGEALARYIRHQYPVALIDESQDVNTEQALLIQRIYLDNTLDQTSDQSPEQAPNKSPSNKRPEKLFLLLVGDPKQAIYGFRGGDVHNYTTLKKQFREPIPLLHNHRSSKGLIDSLNQWYGVAHLTDSDSQNLEQHLDPSQPYFMGNEIFYRKIAAKRDFPALITQAQAVINRQNADNADNNADNNADKKSDNEAANVTPALPTLFYLNVPYQFSVDEDQIYADTSHTDTAKKTVKDTAKQQKKDKKDSEFVDYADAVAAQILALLDNTDPDPLVFEERDDNKIPIKTRLLTVNDMCVLARRNRELNEIEKTLHAHGIATMRSGNDSVFGDVMSEDLQTLMTAILSPYHLGKLKTLLMTKFFRLSLAQATALLEQETTQPNVSFQGLSQSMGESQSLASQITNMLVKAGELWQKDGFLGAIQWLMSQSLTLPKQPRQTFWQRLATDSEGERLLIDLRHLLDILTDTFASQKTGVGEYQLFDWYCQQRQLLPKEDWSIQQRLPSENGVQLMTIHRSKGLEFPIVFVVGLDKSGARWRESTHPLYLYSKTADSQANQHIQANQTNQSLQDNPLLSRRLSPVSADNKHDFKAIEQTSDIEETLRLMYVALTRARERLYLVTQAGGNVTNHTPLTNFVEDAKSFLPNANSEQAVTLVDINSLSKYIKNNTQLAQIQTTNDQPTSYPLDYTDYINAITNEKFYGWSNTSFTALSRFVSHDRQQVAIHEPDYDGLTDMNEGIEGIDGIDTSHIPNNIMSNRLLLAEDFDKAEPLIESPPINGLILPKPILNETLPHEPLSDYATNLFNDEMIDNSLSALTPPDWHHETFFSQNIPDDFIAEEFWASYPDELLDTAAYDNDEYGLGHEMGVDIAHFEAVMGERELTDATLTNDEWYAIDTSNSSYATNTSDASYYPPMLPEYDMANHAYPVQSPLSSTLPQASMSNPAKAIAHTSDSVGLPSVAASSLPDESQLLRFTFERGASAGTFLHKVLEELANNPLPNTFDDTIISHHANWLPPKRWAVMIDRALRRQQLPLHYYSSYQASQGALLRLAEMDEPTYRASLQLPYIELAKWLDEVIHTPLGATGQRPIDIHYRQKSAEMGFNMRLYKRLSLSLLNDLFQEQGIALNLQSQHAQSTVWQYLRGEIDLVYQHDNRFYVVDYKSNYLGDTFTHYQQNSLVQAMNEHRYWLQAAIYQVALHRFLQLRLPNYNIHEHLGAVEYAFIRGMSPQQDTGRLVWQPDVEFILQLDRLFGYQPTDN